MAVPDMITLSRCVAKIQGVEGALTTAKATLQEDSLIKEGDCQSGMQANFEQQSGEIGVRLSNLLYLFK